MTAVTAWNTTVQAPPSLKVFKTVWISDMSKERKRFMLTFGSSENMKSNQHGVVQQKHDRRELEGSSWKPWEEQRSDIADVHALGMLCILAVRPRS